MAIDIFFLVLLSLAVYKGLGKGFIMSVFSVLGFMIGLAAALKLSAVVAGKLSVHTGNAKWLPLVSFLIVFLFVAFLISLAGRLVQKTFEAVMLGWANRIAGVVLYALLYSIIYSVFLFYAVQLHFINQETIAASVVYSYIQPIGPYVMNGIGNVIPLGRGLFAQLEDFFAAVSK